MPPLAGMVLDGDPVSKVASWYDLSEDQVQQAVDFTVTAQPRVLDYSLVAAETAQARTNQQSAVSQPSICRSRRTRGEAVAGSSISSRIRSAAHCSTPALATSSTRSTSSQAV